MESMLEQVRTMTVSLWEHNGLMDKRIKVEAGPLTVEQAIGNPEGKDYPIQKGKEKLMEASFHGGRGQAFSENYGDYWGTLAKVAGLSMDDNFHRAVFVATLNAVMRSLGLADHTVHCRDCGPKECSQALPGYIREHYGNPRVTIVGFQPAMAEAMSREMDVRLIDLDPDNVGQRKRGVLVEGADMAADAMNWAELLLVTGTTLANNTIDSFLSNKPVLFYGTTIAGAASLMGWDRYCPQST